MDNQKNKNSIEIEVHEDREMSNSDVETVASLLFSWWKREFEGQNVFNDSIGMEDNKK